MNTLEINLSVLTKSELRTINGGVIIALCICCFAAGVAIGLMIV